MRVAAGCDAGKLSQYGGGNRAVRFAGDTDGASKQRPECTSASAPVHRLRKKVDRVIAAALAANDVTPELKETLESLRLSEEFARVVVHEKEGRQWDNKSLNVTVRRR